MSGFARKVGNLVHRRSHIVTMHGITRVFYRCAKITIRVNGSGHSIQITGTRLGYCLLHLGNFSINRNLVHTIGKFTRNRAHLARQLGKTAQHRGKFLGADNHHQDESD